MLRSLQEGVLESLELKVSNKIQLRYVILTVCLPHSDYLSMLI